MSRQICMHCKNPLRLSEEARAKMQCGSHLLCSSCINTNYNTMGWGVYKFCKRCFDFMFNHMHKYQSLECAICKSNINKIKLKRLCQNHFLCSKCIRFENCRDKLKCNFCNHAISRLCAECILPYHLPVVPNKIHPFHSYCNVCVKNLDEYICKICKPNYKQKEDYRREKECYFCREMSCNSLIPMCKNHFLCYSCIVFFSNFSLKDLHIIDCDYCEDALRQHCENKTKAKLLEDIENKQLLNEANEEKKALVINSHSLLNNPRNAFASEKNSEQLKNKKELKFQGHYREEEIDSYKSLDHSNMLYDAKNAKIDEKKESALPSEPCVVNKSLCYSSELMPSNQKLTTSFSKPELIDTKNQHLAYKENPNIIYNLNEVSYHNKNFLANYKSAEPCYDHLSQNVPNVYNYQEYNYPSNAPQKYPNNLDSSYDFNFDVNNYSYIQNSGTSIKNSQYSDDLSLSSQSYQVQTYSKCVKHNTDCIFFEDCHHYQCYHCISEVFERKFNKFLESLSSRDLNWLNKSHKSLGCKIKHCINKFCVPFDYVKHIAENICLSNGYPQEIAHHYQLFFEGIKATFFICPNCTYTSGYYFEKKCLYCKI